MDLRDATWNITKDVLPILQYVQVGGTLTINLNGVPLTDGQEIDLFKFVTSEGSFDDLEIVTEQCGVTGTLEERDNTFYIRLTIDSCNNSAKRRLL